MPTLLIYDGSFTGFLTCVFNAYEQGLKKVNIAPVNHSYLKGLFFDTQEILSESHKAARVWRAICTRAPKGKRDLYYSFLSEHEGVEDTLFAMIQYILSNDRPVDSDYSNPFVLKVGQIAKKVAREKHRMEAFVRFRLTKEDIYFATIEPDFHVLPLIKAHFKRRYADQKWMIYDVTRKLGIYYDLKKVTFITLHLDPKVGMAGAPEAVFHKTEAEFQRLWQQYYKSATIESRINSKLHTQHVPRRYWKYLTEKSGLL